MCKRARSCSVKFVFKDRFLLVIFFLDHSSSIKEKPKWTSSFVIAYKELDYALRVGLTREITTWTVYKTILLPTQTNNQLPSLLGSGMPSSFFSWNLSHKFLKLLWETIKFDESIYLVHWSVSLPSFKYPVILVVKSNQILIALSGIWGNWFTAGLLNG